MAIADRINEMYTHVGDVYDTITNVDLPTNKNIQNIPQTIKDSYLEIMNNGIDRIWNNWEKVAGSGTSISLSPTLKAPMKNELKGNTSQTGTPTPTSPIPVNVVSGDNTITISNQGGTDSNTYNIDLPVENLLKIPYYTSDGTYQGVTFTTNPDGSINVNGTATSTIYFNLLRDNNQEVLKNDATFTISGGNPNVELYFNGDNHFDTGQGVTWTYTSSITSTRLVSIRIQNGKTVNATIFPMLEVGTKVNTFTPYGTTPIELCKIGNYQDYFGKSDGSQLFDKDNANVLDAFFDAGSITSSSSGAKTIYIPCKPNTTYTMSKKVGARFQLAYSNTTPVIGGSVLGTIVNNTGSSITITTGNQAQYLVSFCFASADTDTWGTILNSIMINEGSSALPWQPYGVGKWYLHKEIGKTVFVNSTSNWTYISSSVFPYRYTINDKITPTSWSYNLYCNCYTPRNERYDTAIVEPGNSKSIAFRDTSVSTLQDFLNLLVSKNGIAYYVLSTPTNTEITDTTLINQLEELCIAKSKENQTNISQINNDLGFIISASALKKG